jgi:prepilin-type N-terminal cleavage/methylation domain-containing protein
VGKAIAAVKTMNTFFATHKSHKQTQNSILRRGWRRGFTALELIAVIVVLGLIAGAGTYGVRKLREGARINAIQTNVKMVNRALIEFADAGGTFGSYNKGTTDSDGQLSSTPAAALIQNLRDGVYLNGVVIQVNGEFAAEYAAYALGTANPNNGAPQITASTAGSAGTVPP